MTHRALLVAALVLSFGAASAAPKYFEAAATLAVRAGVGGAARPGRWLPVDVTVTAGADAQRGAVVVEWGGAIARRDVDLAPSSTARVTLLVRTIAAAPAIRVSLIHLDGTVAASTETPLALLPVDDPATLCIGAAAAGATCSVTIPETEAPRDWRGFDIADEVVWSATRAASNEETNAFALWRAVRWWQDSAFVDPVVAPFDSNSRLLDRTSFSLMAFAGALVLFSGLTLFRRAPLMLIAGVPLAVAAGGVALVTRSSRDVDIQAASFIHQFTGVPRAIVLVKGDIEHPGTQTLELVPEIGPASLDVVRGLQRTDGTTSADDRAMYRNTAGRGVRQRFELNGTLDAEWLAVTDQPGAISVQNRSAYALTECELRSNETLPIGTIDAGGTARVVSARGVTAGDSLVCRLPAGWMKWSARGATVTTRGSAFLVLHIWPGTAQTSAVAVAAR